MDKEAKEQYIEAGRVVQEARQIAREQAEPGIKLYDLAEKIESHIREEGLKPAFPVNLSINHEAAHYTPSSKDKRVLNKDDVVKIDIGAQKNGYIADSALTINPSGKHQEIIDHAEQVLQKALDFVEPGKTVGELGTFIENQINDEYTPVANLTGHYLGQYKQHAGVSIPNIANTNQHKFKEGDAVAIEPFISTGSGQVIEGNKGNIYKTEKSTGIRNRTARKVWKKVKEYQELPFTDRWIEMNPREKMAFQKLVKSGNIHSYPILQDKNQNAIIVQAEHTVLIGKGEQKENFITTRK